MPHTNTSENTQKVYTKQGNTHRVEPGETINEEALRVLEITPEPEPAPVKKRAKKKSK